MRRGLGLTRLAPGAYEALLRKLYAVNQQHGAVKQGLRNIDRLDAALGRPSAQLNVVHVTGTNGKGSVCWKVARALQASGRRTGLFTSPHIACFRERLRIDGELISEEDTVRGMDEVMAVARAEDIPATFFELVTALALTHFARSRVDALVLEVGLGGRLDSTNVVPRPALTAITNIGLEHTRVLGDTPEAIAREKAGIAKADVPMLVGPSVPLAPVREVCAAAGAPLSTVAEVLGEPEAPELAAVLGYDAENIRSASAAIKLLGLDPAATAVAAALRERPPCRFEVLRPGQDRVVVLDVAHNEPGLEVLMLTLRARLGDLRGSSPSGPMRLVMAMSADKGAERCMAVLRRNDDLFDEVFLSEAPSTRAQSCHVLLQAFTNSQQGSGNKGGRVPPTVVAEPDLRRALELAEGPGVTVVCGSTFMMSSVFQHLGLERPVDMVEHKAVVEATRQPPQAAAHSV